MDKEKKKLALEAWERMKDHAVKKLCGGKCRARSIKDVKAGDVFFSDEEVIMEPEDFADGEELDALKEFLAENGDLREWKHGVWVQVQDDLTVTAKDGSRVFVLFYENRNTAQAMLAFRDKAGQLMLGEKPIRGKDPLFKRVLAGYFDIFMRGLRVWDGFQYTDIEPEEFCVSDSSIERFYILDDGMFKLAFLRLTDRICKSWAGRLRRSALTRRVTNPDGCTDLPGIYTPLRKDIIIEGVHYIDRDITEAEFSAVCKGFGRYAPDVVEVLTETYEDIRMTEEEHALAVKAAKEEVDKISAIIHSHSQEILRAFCKGFGIDPSLPEDEAAAMLRNEEGSAMIDCGSAHFRFEDKDKDRIIRRAGGILTKDSACFCPDGKFFLDMPFVTQSATVGKLQAREIVRLAAEEGIMLTCGTSLD